MVIVQKSSEVDQPAAAAPRQGSTSGVDRFSPRIQGLRAIAVGSVVLFHIWPHRLTGGYVGVDVFFVISGFLICGHLLRELESTGRIALGRFWARRIRRLLPAAFLVLAACFVAVVVLVPAAMWGQNLAEIRAAAMYVENWQLVAEAVDYLGATNAPSLVQHYWSLSVEEQFYVLVPLILLLAYRLARRRRGIVVALVALTVLSLGFSLLLTAAGDPSAYFSTATRAWEFGAGALVAVLPSLHLGDRARGAAGWLGLIGILAAVALYDEGTPFPGVAAVLPVAGTALVLAAGASAAPWSADRVLGAAPMRRIGDWSYAIYLWHWPVVVVAPIVLGHAVGLGSGIVMLLLVIVLGWLTKVLVEDRLRRPTGPRLVPVYRTMIVSVVVTALATSGTAVAQATSVDRALRTLGDHAGPCFGAAAMIAQCADPFSVSDTVQPDLAAKDVTWQRGIAAARRCTFQDWMDAPDARACTYGATGPVEHTIALLGDSHASHLVDPLAQAAVDRGWRLVVFQRASCSGLLPDPAGPDGKPGALPDCATWTERVRAEIKERTDIDVVLLANYTRAHNWTAEEAALSMSDLVRAGKIVIPIRDVPGMTPGQNAPACIDAHDAVDDPCTRRPPGPDAFSEGGALAGLQVVDLDDLFCSADRCHAVIGGLVVYTDEDHLTLTYAKTLAPMLGSRVAEAIASSS